RRPPGGGDATRRSHRQPGHLRVPTSKAGRGGGSSRGPDNPRHRQPGRTGRSPPGLLPRPPGPFLMTKRSAKAPSPGIRLLAAAVIALLACQSCHRHGKNKVIQPVDQVYHDALQKMKKKRYYAARSLLQSVETRIPQDDRELL